MKIVFLDSETIRPDIKIPKPSFPHVWISYKNTLTSEILARVRDADVIITNKVVLNRENLSEAKSLKLIAVTATGIDNIDAEYCKAKGIEVHNVAGYSSSSVAEHCLSMMFELTRQLKAHQTKIIEGAWRANGCFYLLSYPFENLEGKTLGIVGSGSIGSKLSEKAKGIGLKTFFSLRKGDSQKSLLINGKHYVNFDELIETSDIIALCCPLNEETRNLIALEELRKMQSHALLINNARGGVVNEKDLARAIHENLIGGAACDVATEEPLSEAHCFHEILTNPKFILTPHIAWASKESVEILCAKLILQINDWHKKIATN